MPPGDRVDEAPDDCEHDNDDEDIDGTYDDHDVDMSDEYGTPEENNQ